MEKEIISFQQNLALFIGRIMVVIGLIPNGIRKIADFEITAAMMGGAAPQLIDGRLFPAQAPLFSFPLPEFFLSIAIVFDLFGAVLLLAGVRARTVATILTVYCIVAMLIYHTDISSTEGVKAILRNLPLVGGLLLLSGIGAGRWSVDGVIANRRN